MTKHSNRRSRWSFLALVIGASVVAATLVYADCRIAATAGHAAPETVEAHFTGEFDRGAPVYRLPSITVSASRNEAVIEARAPKRDAREQKSRTRVPS